MPMERLPRTACALCGATEFRPKLEINRASERFSIVECEKCRHVFVVDPPKDTANHIDINKIGWGFRPRHHQIRRLLLSHLRMRPITTTKIIEIGCGRGEVGYLVRDLSAIPYLGFEPARGLSDFGIRAGVPIVQDLFKGDRTADAIVIDNVLEHVAEPLQLLKTARLSLNPGGLLIVITPNVDDIRAVSSTWRTRNLWIPPDHINFFSAKDIRFMFNAIGLEPRRFKFSPLRLSDYKFMPRAMAESFGLSIFGHNIYATN